MKLPYQVLHDLTDAQTNFEKLQTATTPVWTPLAYAANYADAGGTEQGSGWWKDINGHIHVRGAVKKTVAWVANEAMFTLPAGARPALTERFTCGAVDHTAGAFLALATVQSSGVVLLQDWTPVIGAPAALDSLWLGHIIFQQAR